MRTADSGPNHCEAMEGELKMFLNLKSIFWGLYCFTTYTDILSIHHYVIYNTQHCFNDIARGGQPLDGGS